MGRRAPRGGGVPSGTSIRGTGVRSRTSKRPGTSGVTARPRAFGVAGWEAERPLAGGEGQSAGRTEWREVVATTVAGLRPDRWPQAEAPVGAGSGGWVEAVLRAGRSGCHNHRRKIRRLMGPPPRPFLRCRARRVSIPKPKVARHSSTRRAFVGDRGGLLGMAAGTFVRRIWADRQAALAIAPSEEPRHRPAPNPGAGSIRPRSAAPGPRGSAKAARTGHQDPRPAGRASIALTTVRHLLTSSRGGRKEDYPWPWLGSSVQS